MTTKDNNGKAHLSTAGSRVRLQLVKNDELQKPEQAAGVVDKIESDSTTTPRSKSRSPLVSLMAAYADAIDREVAALMNDLV